MSNNNTLDAATLVVSSFSAIAASASAAFALWQVKVQREHNQKTVRPCLEFHFDRDTVSGHKLHRLTIANHGFGPAIIKAYRLVKQGQTLDEKRTPAQLAAEYCKSRGTYLATPHTSRKGLDGVLAAGQKTVIFEIEVKEFVDDAAGDDDDIEIEYDYISIYGDKFTVTTAGNYFKL